MSKVCLVTGGAGFIGSHLCERLLHDGSTVLCLDNFYTGKRENIAHLLGHERFELIRHDIWEPISLEADQIYNLACPASPRHYQARAIETTKTAVLGAINTLEIAKRTGARILQASTSEIYGDPQIHPQKEDYWGYVNPVGIRACYDEGKRCAETLFFDYYRESNVDIRIARIFNTYGPRMCPNDGRVVSNFICAALNEEPIEIYSDGEQTRSFCYIDDMVNGLVRLMETDLEPQPVNLGNPDEKTIKELADKVLEKTQSTSQLIYKPKPLDEPVRRKPDISRAKKLLMWEPRISLDEGLEKTITHFMDIEYGKDKQAHAKAKTRIAKAS